MEDVLMFVFFPALYEASEHEHSTYITARDEEILTDQIYLPSIYDVIKCSNTLQELPSSYRVAYVDALAMSAEGLAKKQGSRLKLLQHNLQTEYLEPIWDQILERIETNPAFHRFRGATLFMHTKNTKDEYISRHGLTTMYEKWHERWSDAADPRFYDNHRTYVDVAKQISCEDTALPTGQVSDEKDAEVFLWRNCCLNAYKQGRIMLDADGGRAKGSPRCTTYSWANMRDAAGLTLFAAPAGQESQDGLVYSQFYQKIKTPFDSTKVYVFDNDSVENLALDPSYVRSLQQAGGGITFSKGVCEYAYLHSKKRAHYNVVDNDQKSYGIREEHRITLAMMEQIYQQWLQWDRYDGDEIADEDRPLPYFIMTSKETFAFLRAVINRNCLLFERTRAEASRAYSLAETSVMVIGLRSLRFCYSSSLLPRESLLYKDRWEGVRNGRIVVKEGLGMKHTMERCGFGWFLPKFDWTRWRLKTPHAENILVGNLLMHEEYRRRWRAVKDLRDAHIRLDHQAVSWYEQYHIQDNEGLIKLWLEYLHALNLEQFDADVWRAMLKADKRTSELRPEVIREPQKIQFCHAGMREMFTVDGVATGPHFVTGNKMKFENAIDLVHYLFMWDNRKRRGWGEMTYRMILRKTFDLIERRLGRRRAQAWLDEFIALFCYTHWVIPYATETAFFGSTKASQTQGLRPRMMWFSMVYANPRLVEVPIKSCPTTLFFGLRNARREAFMNTYDFDATWSTSALLKGLAQQGVQIRSHESYWTAGKKSIGLKGFKPVWERGRPPVLKMLRQIQKKTLDELDELMGRLTQECGQGAEAGLGPRTAALAAERNIRERAEQRLGSEDTTEETRSNSAGVTASSGSIFEPDGLDNS
jgi:hypothetical protein